MGKGGEGVGGEGGVDQPIALDGIAVSDGAIEINLKPWFEKSAVK